MAGEGIKLTAKVTNKSKNNKGLQFEGQEGWFSVPEKLTGFSEKINKGDIVEVTFIKKGTFRNVIYLGTGAVAKEEPKEAPENIDALIDGDGKDNKDGEYSDSFIEI